MLVPGSTRFDRDSFGKTSELPAQAIKKYDHALKNGLNTSGHSVGCVAGSKVGCQATFCGLPPVLWPTTGSSTLDNT
eukprot:2850216-Amphidinium_carterae.1